MSYVKIAWLMHAPAYALEIHVFWSGSLVTPGVERAARGGVVLSQLILPYIAALDASHNRNVRIPGKLPRMYAFAVVISAALADQLRLAADGIDASLDLNVRSPGVIAGGNANAALDGAAWGDQLRQADGGIDANVRDKREGQGCERTRRIIVELIKRKKLNSLTI